MYLIKTEHHFDAAHFLYGYEGKCSNIHGHRWTVIVAVKKEELSSLGNDAGMVVDFGILKDELKKEVDYFDHSLIIEKNTLKRKTYEALQEENFRLIEVEFRPTAENFAKYFYDKMKRYGYLIKSVQVYETPNNCAEYGEE